MSYNSGGRRPFERASKSSHHHVINDPEVQAALASLDFPPREEELSIEGLTVPFIPDSNSSISNIIAVDGGYTEAEIREGFPSALIHFFQFGALWFKLEDLHKLDSTPHISPEDMSRLNNIHRLKLALPTKGVRREGTNSLQDTVRLAIFEFFSREKLGEDSSLLDTLKWFVFRKYKKESDRSSDDKKWLLSSNPLADTGGVDLKEEVMRSDGTFECPETGGDLYLTDIFRLHEIIEEETGAVGVCSYLVGVIEHLVAIHIIRHLIRYDRSALKSTLFIMDRPTGFFGQTARMHILMMQLMNWLFDEHNVYWAGLEKSGAFVDHAQAIQGLMPAGSVLVLNDHHIYQYISPAKKVRHEPMPIPHTMDTR